jgi:UDP-N-acetyl-D-galactosamine dehydrogenase
LITFKENCPDVRNTKIVDVIESFIMEFVTTYDPTKPMEVKHEYALETTTVYPINDLMR